MIDGLTDKQLWRISRHKEFISTYSSLAKGDAGKSWSAYSDFIVGEIKKDASKFSKTPYTRVFRWKRRRL